jgi:transposase-like protein
MVKYLLHCEWCSYKQFAATAEEIKLTPITLCGGNGKLNEGGGRGEKTSKKYKCPQCGRVIRVQSTIPLTKEELKNFDSLM